MQIRNALVEFDRNVGENEGSSFQSKIYIYKMFLAQEKELYKNLNTMKQENQIFIGFFWTPVEQEAYIYEKIVNEESGTKIEPYDRHKIKKPTYFKPNEFSYTF